MTKKSIKYLELIEEDDVFYDIFIMSYIGILGLYQINQKNNLLRLQLKKYRQVLNAVSDESIDVYYMINKLYKNKEIRLNFGVQLISYYQMFRDPNFTLTLKEQEIKELLRKLPNYVYRRLNAQIKFIYKAYINNVLSLTQTVNKFYSYCKREEISEIDFYRFARMMKRKDAPKKPEEELVTEEFKHSFLFDDDEFIDIFKNPSSKEMKEIQEDARGILSDDGNLYIATSSLEHKSGLTHWKIIEELNKKNILKVKVTKQEFYKNPFYSDVNFLCVQRKSKSNDILLGESYTPNEIKQYSNIIDEFLNKNKSSLNLIKKSIVW